MIKTYASATAGHSRMKRKHKVLSILPKKNIIITQFI